VWPAARLLALPVFAWAMHGAVVLRGAEEREARRSDVLEVLGVFEVFAEWCAGLRTRWVARGCAISAGVVQAVAAKRTASTRTMREVRRIRG